LWQVVWGRGNKGVSLNDEVGAGWDGLGLQLCHVASTQILTAGAKIPVVGKAMKTELSETA
jgi:hypothetical protein